MATATLTSDAATVPADSQPDAGMTDKELIDRINSLLRSWKRLAEIEVELAALADEIESHEMPLKQLACPPKLPLHRVGDIKLNAEDLRVNHQGVRGRIASTLHTLRTKHGRHWTGQECKFLTDAQWLQVAKAVRWHGRHVAETLRKLKGEADDTSDAQGE